MSTEPRPTIEQIRSALKWWNALPKEGEARPCKAQLDVRIAMNMGVRQAIGATDIARYWLKNVAPNLPPAEPQQEQTP